MSSIIKNLQAQAPRSDHIELIEHLIPQLFEDLFCLGHVLHAYQFRRHLGDRQLLLGMEGGSIPPLNTPGVRAPRAGVDLA